MLLCVQVAIGLNLSLFTPLTLRCSRTALIQITTISKNIDYLLFFYFAKVWKNTGERNPNPTHSNVYSLHGHTDTYIFVYG